MDAFNYRVFICTIIKAALNTFESSKTLLIIIKTFMRYSLYKQNLGIHFSLKQRSESLSRPVLTVLLWEKDYRGRKKVKFCSVAENFLELK